MALNVITLEIGNSYSKISFLTAGQMSSLRKILSYETNPQAAFYAGGNYPTAKYMIDKQGNFPTGLLPKVKEWLRSEGKIAFTTDLRVRPRTKSVYIADFKGVLPYKAQEIAVEAALKHHHGTISMCTGSGKSLVIALIASRLRVRTLIVVPTLELKKQLTASLSGIFKDMSDITVENIDSSSLQSAKNYDCLIIDEGHHVAAKTYQKLNKNVWKGIYYRFFLTATPFRNNTEETMLFEGIAGTTIFELTYKQAVKSGYVVPVEAYYLEVPRQSTEAYTYQQVYSELVVNNQAANEIISETLLNLQNAGTSTLCLVKEVKHGKLLAELTGCPFVNGTDEDSRHYIRQFNSGGIKVLIGTEGILGEGVDTKPCEFVLIASFGKAKSAFMQKVGRAIRTFPGKASAKVIIIRNRSHKFLNRHFNAQAAILLSEYGIKPQKIGA